MLAFDSLPAGVRQRSVGYMLQDNSASTLFGTRGLAAALAVSPSASRRLLGPGRLSLGDVQAQLDQLAQRRRLAVKTTLEAIVGHALPQLVIKADLSAVWCG